MSTMDSPMNDPAAAARIGIVTVSDRASRGDYADEGGPAIRAYLTEVLASEWRALERLVPDERAAIVAAIRDLAAAGCRAVPRREVALEVVVEFHRVEPGVLREPQALLEIHALRVGKRPEVDRLAARVGRGDARRLTRLRCARRRGPRLPLGHGRRESRAGGRAENAATRQMSGWIERTGHGRTFRNDRRGDMPSRMPAEAPRSTRPSRRHDIPCADAVANADVAMRRGQTGGADGAARAKPRLARASDDR